MSQKLYVGGLAYATTEDSLRNLFAQAGEVVSASVIIDKMSGRSRGFGFVEMSSEEEGEKAISMFDGQEFEGRTLRVSVARPQGDRPQRTGGFRKGGFGGDRGGRRDRF